MVVLELLDEFNAKGTLIKVVLILLLVTDRLILPHFSQEKL